MFEILAYISMTQLFKDMHYDVFVSFDVLRGVNNFK